MTSLPRLPRRSTLHVRLRARYCRYNTPLIDLPKSRSLAPREYTQSNEDGRDQQVKPEPDLVLHGNIPLEEGEDRIQPLFA